MAKKKAVKKKTITKNKSESFDMKKAIAFLKKVSTSKNVVILASEDKNKMSGFNHGSTCCLLGMMEAHGGALIARVIE